MMKPNATTQSADRSTKQGGTEQVSGQPVDRPLATEKVAQHTLPMGVLDIVHAGFGSETLYAACMDGVYQVDLPSGRSDKLYAHDSYVSSVELDHQRNSLISAGYDGQLIWYDLDKRSVYRRIMAHRFWSWRMKLSRDARWVASVTGQYLAGSNDYAPAPESEPSVKIYDNHNGQLVQALSHVPSVHAVAFSRDGRHVAAGNLMGEVRVWNTESGKLQQQWTTDAFTSWGIIKSHCYIGGIHALTFSPDGKHVIVAGMGPMRDPMAGNGRQLWQRFAWQESPAELIDQTKEDEAGEGLMETLAWHPAGNHFLMGGRQRGGEWNAAVFAAQDGRRQDYLSTGYRMTCAEFDANGRRLFVAGAKSQKGPKDGNFPAFGQLEIHSVKT